MTILLTAFEPFDGMGINSSLEACRVFLDRWGAEFDLRFRVLPVSYGADTSVVEAALADQSVDVLLHTGQAGGARKIAVERIAVNVRYATDTPDDSPGVQMVIDPDGPAALFSTLPVTKMAEAVLAEGIPTTLSNHAGVYLCNHVFYRSLRREQLEGTGRRSGFIHLPCLPEQRSAPENASMTAEESARGLRAALRCVTA